MNTPTSPGENANHEVVIRTPAPRPILIVPENLGDLVVSGQIIRSSKRLWWLSLISFVLLVVSSLSFDVFAFVYSHRVPDDNLNTLPVICGIITITFFVGGYIIPAILLVCSRKFFNGLSRPAYLRYEVKKFCETVPTLCCMSILFFLPSFIVLVVFLFLYPLLWNPNYSCTEYWMANYKQLQEWNSSDANDSESEIVDKECSNPQIGKTLFRPLLILHVLAMITTVLFIFFALKFYRHTKFLKTTLIPPTPPPPLELQVKEELELVEIPKPELILEINAEGAGKPTQ